MLRSLRWRLTGWYVVVLAVVLLMFSASTYLAVRAALLENFDEVLVDQATLITQAIDIDDGKPELKHDVVLSGRSSNDHFTRLYATNKTLIFDDTADGPHVPDLPEALDRALHGEKNLIQVQANGATLRVATFPIFFEGQITGVLQVGVSLADIDETLHILLIVLVVMIPLTVLLSSGGGMFLANRALAPIDTITRTAQRISAENLSGRIRLDSVDDEVGRLAWTFDTMLARLEDAFNRQRQFAADASHELRTPLTAIIGQIDVALGWPASADYYRATLVTVREQAQRLTRLANDLLFLARADAHAVPSTIEPINLAHLLPAVVTQMEPLAVAQQHTIVVTPPPTGIVSGDEDQLIRMLLNLLDNAIRYTPPGGQITLSCTETNGTIQISISDTGPGIAPEHLGHLFDRFYRVDRGRSRLQGGSGLGLAITQSIVHMHSGQISVKSVIGHGSTFTVLLPAAATPSRYAHSRGIPAMARERA